MGNVDMHLHTIYSDGTDDLKSLVDKLQLSGVTTFSVTDHDTIDGSVKVPDILPIGLRFIPGVELSCITDAGKCHILGYGYDADNEKLQSLLTLGKQKRRNKLDKRLEHLKSKHSIVFSDTFIQGLYEMNSVGKPHLAKEIVNMGLADSISDAIHKYINDCKTENDRVPANEAVSAVLAAGGVAVWAHPLGGEGEKRITQEKFKEQLDILRSYGIAGLECWYSRYDKAEIEWLLEQADVNSMAVSGGSDYHGKNKSISLGELNCYGYSVNSDKLSILNILQ